MSDSEERLKNLLDVIPDVQLHHALVTNDVIEVIGINLGKDVIKSLQKDGFSSFVETKNSFRASKI